MKTDNDTINNIREYEHSLIRDMEKLDKESEDATNGIESIKEIKDITYGQLYAVRKIMKILEL
jgi:hypothetical protein